MKCAGDAAAGDFRGAVTGDGFAVERDGAGGRAIDAGDEVENRGFACAVGADEADELAFDDGEIHHAHGGEPAEAEGGAFEPQKRAAILDIGHWIFDFHALAAAQVFIWPGLKLNNPCGRASMRPMSSAA